LVLATGFSLPLGIGSSTSFLSKSGGASFKRLGLSFSLYFPSRFGEALFRVRGKGLFLFDEPPQHKWWLFFKSENPFFSAPTGGEIWKFFFSISSLFLRTMAVVFLPE